jgi:hypothetical protein
MRYIIILPDTTLCSTLILKNAFEFETSAFSFMVSHVGFEYFVKQDMVCGGIK